MLVIPNTISFLLLLLAVYFARNKQIKSHKTTVFLTMMTSFVLVYMFVEMRLSGGSIVDKSRMAAFSLGFKCFLFSHIIAASLTFLLACVVCYFGLTEHPKRWHKKIAYILVPIWAYSAVSGLTVFIMVGSPDEDIKNAQHKSISVSLANKDLRFISDDTGPKDLGARLKGAWSLLYIGYTNCPDICPTSLVKMGKALDLRPDIQGYFITADPKRDIESKLKLYVTNFNKNLKYLRSNDGDEKRLSESLGAIIEIDSAGESVFHPTSIYLVNPEAQVVAEVLEPKSHKDILVALNHFTQASQLKFSNAWVRAPLKGTNKTAAYVKIENLGHESLKVVRVESESFKKIELHEVIKSEKGAKMREVSELTIEAQNELELKPGGHHLMLFEPKIPIEANVAVHFIVYMANGLQQEFKAQVRASEGETQDDLHEHHNHQ